MGHFSEKAFPTVLDENNWNFFKTYFEAVQKLSKIVCLPNAEIPHQATFLKTNLCLLLCSHEFLLP